MNKKFLSAILFGALMVSSTGTFVSCKDYDDDIDSLWDAVGGKASADDLKTQVESMKTLLNEATTSAKEAKDAADKATLAAEQAVKDAKTAADKAIAEAELATATAKSEAANAKVEAIAEATKQVEALEAKLTEALKQKVDQSKFNELAAQVANLQAVVEGIAGKQLKSLVFVPSLYMDGVESFEAKYMPYNAIALKTGSTTAVYNQINYSTAEANDINENRAVKVTVNNPTMRIDYHMNPSTTKVADFQNNLSFVSADKDFVATERAADAAPVASYISHNPATGILTVGVDLDGTKVKNQASVNEPFYEYANASNLITVLALQADVKGENGDTIVTSDYAGVYASQVVVEAIAYGKDAKVAYTPTTDCNEPATGRHLFKHVKSAIEAEPTVNVAWNSSIDLSSLTCTHYLSNSKSSFGNDGKVKVWANGEERDYNLTFKYDLVDYKGGTNATSESQNSQLNGSVLRPCGVVSSTGLASGIQGIETVGRMPLVRVTLLDTKNNNQIVAIGYIKLHIVESETPKVTSVFDKGNVFYTCADQSVKLTWSETQTELLGLTAATSKATFDALYELEKKAGSTIAVQYYKNAAGEYAVAPDYTTASGNLPFIVGEVDEVVDATAPTTTCLQWTMGQIDFAQLRKYATVNTTAKTITYSYTVYVKYVGKGTTGNTGVARTPIYVPIKVTFNYPYGTLNNKLATKWYAANSTTNGNAEIHVNVEVPKTTVEIEGVAAPAACNFRSDLDSYFMVNTTKKHAVTNIAGTTAASGDAPTFGVASSFTDWQDAKLAYVYYFTAANDYRNSAAKISGNSTTKYNLYIGTSAGIVTATELAATATYDEAYQSSGREYNYNVLWATVDGAATTTAQMVAVITDATGVVTYQNTDYAKDLLNYDSHKVLANTLTAEVGVAAFNECANLLPLADKTFNSKFLRPVDVNPGEVKNFTDAVDGTVESTATVNGAWAYVLNLVSLSDWRDQLFITSTAATDGKNLDYFNYYGVKEIKIDVATITTDMTGTWKLLSDVNKSIYFTYTNATSTVPAANATLADLKTAYGRLNYFNNTGNTTEFNVKVPVTVVYKWGEITTEVSCHIGGTLNN